MFSLIFQIILPPLLITAISCLLTMLVPDVQGTVVGTAAVWQLYIHPRGHRADYALSLRI